MSSDSRFAPVNSFLNCYDIRLGGKIPLETYRNEKILNRNSLKGNRSRECSAWKKKKTFRVVTWQSLLVTGLVVGCVMVVSGTARGFNEGSSIDSQSLEELKVLR